VKRDASFGRKKALSHLAPGLLEGKIAHGDAMVEGDVAYEIHDESRFAHARSGADHDYLAGVKTPE
jgi:hypothetical protein